jgi:hypothetical protein
MPERKRKDWRELCTAVSNERDSNKLVLLVEELIRALDDPEREPCVDAKLTYAYQSQRSLCQPEDNAPSAMTASRVSIDEDRMRQVMERLRETG